VCCSRFFDLSIIYHFVCRESICLGSVGAMLYSRQVIPNFASYRFMSQLTLARFRGDTASGLVSRIGSTFFGVIVGMVMWSVGLCTTPCNIAHVNSIRYISCGSGHGNPYGLAAVFAVFFPFCFYGRLYWPGAPLTNIIFFVSAMLVRPLYCMEKSHLTHL
jgi:hypothetical protein